MFVPPCNILYLLYDLVYTIMRSFSHYHRSRKVTYRNFKDYNKDKLLKDLALTPFHIISVFDDASDRAWPSASCLPRSLTRMPQPSNSILGEAMCLAWLLRGGKLFDIETGYGVNIDVTPALPTGICTKSRET